MPGFSILLIGMFAELMGAPLLGKTPGALQAAGVITGIVLLAALFVVRRGRAALFLFAVMIARLVSLQVSQRAG